MQHCSDCVQNDFNEQKLRFLSCILDEPCQIEYKGNGAFDFDVEKKPYFSRMSSYECEKLVREKKGKGFVCTR